ncbi:hypothetical protein LCGC14_1490440 [marine sediment metagenome]|uniref:Uncharacterized protein n=1 Tax=marine sediment metagenome TaxID=412755 RepID=A0A0F9LMF0_9ZZZZ
MKDIIEMLWFGGMYNVLGTSSSLTIPLYGVAGIIVGATHRQWSKYLSWNVGDLK